ncbi:hypothetical protein BGZ80_010694 [Entomortierella chlamydospora]|uniref:Uncharacterized protein n=1 Tax=Entomortierella chlamydospora TaxID=101097 RepID=A0A9P6SZP1_9FUNG|nr:hypothetical protein BGZ79_007361 [Entomortierella chlamydospora]KAG0014039.1 hypothetical protein BGZ80_010694 [Entomortierella chlamydospora]
MRGLVLVAITFLVITLLLSHTADAASGTITLSQLTKAFAGNCPKKTKGDAITCKDALPYINAAIKKYKLKTRGQRAAYIATMAYEGGYLKYNHNLNIHSQGTRSIMPAISLRTFVNANKSVQKYFPGFPNINNDSIVDVLIKKHADFEPGAWWTVSGPGCAKVAAHLSSSKGSFVAWETGCINGGSETIAARAAIYKTVYAAIK